MSLEMVTFALKVLVTPRCFAENAGRVEGSTTYFLRDIVGDPGGRG